MLRQAAVEGTPINECKLRRRVSAWGDTGKFLATASTTRSAKSSSILYARKFVMVIGLKACSSVCGLKNITYVRSNMLSAQSPRKSGKDSGAPSSIATTATTPGDYVSCPLGLLRIGVV